MSSSQSEPALPSPDMILNHSAQRGSPQSPRQQLQKRIHQHPKRDFADAIAQELLSEYHGEHREVPSCPHYQHHMVSPAIMTKQMHQSLSSGAADVWLHQRQLPYAALTWDPVATQQQHPTVQADAATSPSKASEERFRSLELSPFDFHSELIVTPARGRGRSKDSVATSPATAFNPLLMLAEATTTDAEQEATPSLFESPTPSSSVLSPIKSASSHDHNSTDYSPSRGKSCLSSNGEVDGTDSWEKYFGLLQEFHAKYGHCTVPLNWKECPELAEWVSLQGINGWARRQEPAKPAENELSDERMVRLSKLGFVWTAPEIWEDMFAQLCLFYQNHGHVPKRYKENTKLAHWVEKQREFYRQHQQGIVTPLTADRIECMRQMGFQWDVQTSNHETWEGMFDKLLEYFAQYGHCNVPDKCKDHPKLGRWVRMQRRHYKLQREGKYSSLTQDRLQKLNSINFQWTVKEQWMDMYKKLQAFQSQHGHCNVPQKWREDPKLGVWVHHQRRFYKLRKSNRYSTLTDDRIELLSKLSFSWDSPDKSVYHLQYP